MGLGDSFGDAVHGAATDADGQPDRSTCELPLVEDPETAVFSYAGVETALDAACEI